MDPKPDRSTDDVLWLVVVVLSGAVVGTFVTALASAYNLFA